MKPLIAGTRGSDLALWQTRHVQRLLGVPTEERVVTTRGDVDMSERLVGKLDKGFFTEELEAGLRDGSLDFAVHSLKDLPTQIPAGLALGAVLPRADAADLLLIRPESWVDRGALLPVRPGGRIGTCSLRREVLVGRYAPGCLPVPLRGNVPTRLHKLREGLYDAIVLAQAGVDRLGLDLSGLVAVRLDPRAWPPAPGQGALAVECRADDAVVLGLLGALGDDETARATTWERAFLRALEGGCATPFGAYVVGSRGWLVHQGELREIAVPAGLPGDDLLSILDQPGVPTDVPVHLPL